MKKLLFIGLVGLILSLSFMKPCMASDEFTEMPSALPEGQSYSFAWGDYDNDGYLDLCAGSVWDIATGYSPTKIYHNNGDGTFTSAIDLIYGSNADMDWGDYDNDGYLDLALTVTLGNADGTTKLYHNNNGDGTFTEISSGVVNVGISSLSWGDYDNDGYIDLAIIGQLTVCGPDNVVAKLYHNNNGDGTFTEANVNLTGVDQGSVAWGDYDNDGRLDLAISGLHKLAPGTYEPSTKIYHNNGDSTFTEISSGVVNVWASSLSWGDYDNDGYIDLAILGRPVFGYERIAKIYHNNNGDGTFTDSGIVLPEISEGSISWGDYDNDGDLDLALCGVYITSLEASYIYENTNGVFTDINAGLIDGHCLSWGDYDNDGDLDIVLASNTLVSGIFDKLYRNNLGSNTPTPNVIPNAPSSLQANVSGNNVTLSWQKATDSQTPQDGLYYNIFVGTSPNGVQIESPMAEVPGGFRRIAAIGSQNENISWTINSLADGTYYWGVQAIDTAFAGSPFALGTFTIGSPTTYTISGTVTLNGNGLEGVTLEDGSGNYLATTDANGLYSFTEDAGWSEMVIPYKQFFTFTPPNRTYNNLSGNQEDQDYAAALNTYTISGTVTLNGSGLEGVDLKDSQGYLLAVTDPVGYYAFIKEHGWTETVTPYKVGYAFDPVSMSYNLSGNQDNQDYMASLNQYTISGTVTLDGGGLSGVDITENGTTLATTASDGTYSFIKVAFWSGTVTPVKTGHYFEPISRKYINITSDYTKQDYEATLLDYTINGRIYLEDGTPVGGVELLDEDDEVLAITHEDGEYYFVKPYGWSGAVKPQKDGYKFDPDFRFYAFLEGDLGGEDYIAIPLAFMISGAITWGDTAHDIYPLEGVELTNLETGETLDVTDEKGLYEINVDSGWTGTIVPVKDGYIFDPESRSYQNVHQDYEGENYRAKLGLYTISGAVYSYLSADRPKPVAGVSIIDIETQRVLAVTDIHGEYSFSKHPGWSGTVKPVKDPYTFVPVTRSYENLSGNLDNQNYEAYD